MAEEESMNKQPRKWSFDEDTDYDAVDVPVGAENVKIFEDEADNEDVANVTVNRRQKRVPEDPSQRYDPDTLPRAVSKKLAKYSLDESLLIFTSPDSESRRVVIKMDKEIPVLAFAAETIRFDEDHENILIMAHDGGALGLVLSGMRIDLKQINRGRNFLYCAADPNDGLVADRNIYANEVFVNNLDLIKRDEIASDSVDAVVFQPEPFLGKAVILEQLVYIKRILRIGGGIYVLAHKKSGAGSYQEMVAQVFGEDNMRPQEVGMGGNRLMIATKRDNSFPEIGEAGSLIEVSILGHSYKVETLPGLFSKDGLDKGTRILLDSTSDKINASAHILDVGCGWGAIGITAAMHNTEATIDMVDVDGRAVECAQSNVTRNELGDRVNVHQSASLSEVVDQEIDLVLSNPPFHESESILISLFSETRSVMRKGTEAYFVVEDTYLGKFQHILEEVFGNVTVHKDSENGYTVLRSRK